MSTRFRIVIFILLFISCQKFEWNNPYDPDCPKDLFTPTSQGVTMEGNSVKLTWSQQNDRISGFTLFRRAEGESITTLSQIQKSTTQYVDANITPGKKYTYFIVAVAGTNSSDTVKAEIVPVFPVTISTGAVTELAETSAKLSGNITSAGGGTVTSRGICWSTTPSPTINNSKTTEGTGVGVFTSSLVNLLVGTTYYARAYGENSRGISYGSEVVFTTRGLPTLTTTAVSNITANTANSGGTINGDGGSPITTKGIVWSILPNPTVELTTKTNEGTGSNSYSSSLAGLTPNVKYYIRAYATNANGTAYGQEISFTTLLPSLPTLTTNLASSITTNSAVSGGNISADGGSVVTARGICWNVVGSPTIVNARTQDESGVGAFTSSMTGLTPNTTYFVRAYATNAAGTSYGQEITFTTTSVIQPTLPTLTTNLASAITTNSAVSGGNITADGGSAVTARGICWNVVGSPTIVNARTQDGSSVGAFTSSMTGLTPNTTYFVRAYATNAAGTSYGQEITFTTTSVIQPTLPTLTTNLASSITTNSAVSGGNISADGGSAVTARGICWNVVGSPTIVNTRTQDGSGIGVFNSSMTGLTPNTTYFVRAYATNEAGTSYGQEISFTTLLPSLSTLTTNLASSITTNSAVSGGNISADGGSAVTARGICWNITGSPTIANTRTQDGSGIGVFNSSMTELTPNTTYFVRAYATNAAGTSYGQQISFTTPPSLPTLTTNLASAIATNSAVSGGNITADGRSQVSARGICWNTTGSPTIANTRTQDGIGAGLFTSSMTGLTPNTTYFVRAYATNGAGTAYGQEISFTTGILIETCSITGVTNGTIYNMQAPVEGSIFTAGSLYKITMASSTFSFGQATEVALYRNELKVYSFGGFLLFNENPGNARTFTIPNGMIHSGCYTIRVTKAEGSTSTGVPIQVEYITPKFEIR